MKIRSKFSLLLHFGAFWGPSGGPSLSWGVPRGSPKVEKFIYSPHACFPFGHLNRTNIWNTKHLNTRPITLLVSEGSNSKSEKTTFFKMRSGKDSNFPGNWLIKIPWVHLRSYGPGTSTLSLMAAVASSALWLFCLEFFCFSGFCYFWYFF